VELGVYQGGSCALMALASDPEVLVAIELSDERVPAVDGLIAKRGLSERWSARCLGRLRAVPE
jgi:predicted O-methyltransferase YrrM